MRREFAKLTRELMSNNEKVFVLTGDLGFGMWDAVRAEYPSRTYNVGAAEQLLLGAGAGLALAGKIPLCYSITPFLLYRPFEILRNYINHENIPVKLIGSGRDRDYAHDGFSHWAEDDKQVLDLFPNIETFHPETTLELKQNFERLILSDRPCYINLKR